jgi:hypothetical protein
MDTVHRQTPITVPALTSHQFRIAMGLAVAGLQYDIEQITPNAFGLTLRSGRPAAFHIRVEGQNGGAGTARLAIGATLVDAADSSEAQAIAKYLMDSFPAWCDIVWAVGKAPREAR